MNIKQLEKEVFDLKNALLKKEKELRIAKFGDNGFIELECFFSVNGSIEGHAVTFMRGNSTCNPPFEMFMQYASLVEMFHGGGGTYLDYFIDEYAKLFKIKKKQKEVLIKKYWHDKKLTIKDFVYERVNHYFSTDNANKL